MPDRVTVAIIGGGPAGLMAAEVLSESGISVDLYDAMPSVGRKFLMAGKGGMNITHAEPLADFVTRYGARRDRIEPLLAQFGPETLRAWCKELGIDTFVGSSGRVFPTEMKAAPLLRAWLHRLRTRGVHFHMRHRWQGWSDDGVLEFSNPDGIRLVQADAVVLALGGGSWSKLGSDGAWVPILQQRGVEVATLRPANCGFDVQWSEYVRERFAGAPVKPVVVSLTDASGVQQQRQGEFVVTAHGIEGSVIYALSAMLRDTIEAHGAVSIYLDLLPGKSMQQISEELERPRGRRSLSEHLRRRLGIDGVKAALLREGLSREAFTDTRQLAAALKTLPLTLVAPRPIDEAISTAGGLRFEELDAHLMLGKRPGVFCAGEMLDWEAPTGGYLLTACFASGVVAGQGVREYLQRGVAR